MKHKETPFFKDLTSYINNRIMFRDNHEEAKLHADNILDYLKFFEDEEIERHRILINKLVDHINGKIDIEEIKTAVEVFVEEEDDDE
jgi:hypothetical protein